MIYCHVAFRGIKLGEGYIDLKSCQSIRNHDAMSHVTKSLKRFVFVSIDGSDSRKDIDIRT